MLSAFDRLAHWEQQQQYDGNTEEQHPDTPAAGGGLTQAQLAEARRRLTAMSSSGRRKAWAAHRVMFLPLELGWVLPLTALEWSQLQLLPHIVCRVDSMLAATSMHRQLAALLHGGGPRAATQVRGRRAEPARAPGAHAPLCSALLPACTP